MGKGEMGLCRGWGEIRFPLPNLIAGRDLRSPIVGTGAFPAECRQMSPKGPESMNPTRCSSSSGLGCMFLEQNFGQHYNFLKN